MEDGDVARAPPHVCPVDEPGCAAAPGPIDHQAGVVAAALELATATIKAYNDHDLDALADLHNPSARIKFAGVEDDIGLDAWWASLGAVFTMLPDFTLWPLTVLADEHAAMIEMNLTGTNSGEIPLSDDDQRFLGVDTDRLPPTGRLVEVTGVVVLRTQSGRVNRETHHWPRHWLDESLGLVTVEPRANLHREIGISTNGDTGGEGVVALPAGAHAGRVRRPG
jgi:hypothetical protein